VPSNEAEKWTGGGKLCAGGGGRLLGGKSGGRRKVGASRGKKKLGKTNKEKMGGKKVNIEKRRVKQNLEEGRWGHQKAPTETIQLLASRLSAGPENVRNRNEKGGGGTRNDFKQELKAKRCESKRRWRPQVKGRVWKRDHKKQTKVKSKGLRSGEPGKDLGTEKMGEQKWMSPRKI